MSKTYTISHMSKTKEEITPIQAHMAKKKKPFIQELNSAPAALCTYYNLNKKKNFVAFQPYIQVLIYKIYQNAKNKNTAGARIMNGGFNKQIYKHTGTYVRVEKGSAARKEQMLSDGACIKVEYIFCIFYAVPYMSRVWFLINVYAFDSFSKRIFLYFLPVAMSVKRANMK